MKKIFLTILTMVFVCLWGCAGADPVDTRVQVSVMAAPGCTVEQNSQWVVPGDDAVFVLNMEAGYALAGTDYSGGYDVAAKDRTLELTLKDVQYPVRIELELTRNYATITYLPNGGTGSLVSVEYDLTYHIRPNTANGTDLFTRTGYSLVCWNTEPDGSGVRVGLGSRVSVDTELTLYAQWAPWTNASDFTCVRTQQGTMTVTSYTGAAETVVIPAYIDGCAVTAISDRAFKSSKVRHVILPETMAQVEPYAFLNCTALESVTLYDNIETLSDDVFSGCSSLRTLYINAVEAPWGYDYRKESVYADKVDLLIEAQGQRKLVFYGGCSTWYNLHGAAASEAFDGAYTIINMGLNGTVSSAAQMQIMGSFLEEGDVLLHTLELTSEHQLMSVTRMGENDDKLWCGLEYNYDLVALLDLRTIDGVFDSLTHYLGMKKSQTTYRQCYTDGNGERYTDQYGCIPIYRERTNQKLTDMVRLDQSYVNRKGMNTLESYYDAYRDAGVTVYVSYACVNMDEVPEEQRGNVEIMDSVVRDAVGAMDSAMLISGLSDYLFEYNDFYDTNYHLISEKATENTQSWIRDLKRQMVSDGIWNETE